MVRLSFHASHEQFSPRYLLDCVREAERAGFDGAMSSDHFAPWSRHEQGESGFAWSWLGAALEATRFPIGIITTPVGFRYHPAVIAQASATLEEMYPDRLWVGLGSGEALNEHITGEPWPMKTERNERLLEAADVMRALFRGEEVSRRGHIRVDRARLYTRPERAPLLLGAALTPETAEWLGGWADGLLTVNQSDEKLRDIIDAFYRGGGKGKPLFLQLHLSHAPTEEEALAQAHAQWGTNAVPGAVTQELSMPEHFEALLDLVDPEDVRDVVFVSADREEHAKRIKRFAELGFDEIFLHQVGRDQKAFVREFGKHVLPELR